MTVTIESDRGRLRLRWLHQGKRVNLSLGVDDNPTGRAFAKQKAGQIETDLMAGHYDETLLRYKPRILGKSATCISAPEVFKRFTDYQVRDKGLTPGSLRRYQPVQAHLERRLKIDAEKVSDRIAGDFAAYLAERVSDRTAKEYLWLLRSCWDWAKGRYSLADSNPWTELARKIKPQPQQRVKPFTTGEVRAIINGFRNSKYYDRYTDFVAFLFGVGCRFGEAAGLRWSSIADDFETIWIGESISRGHRKGTKTGKARTVILNSSVSQMLRSRKERLNPKASDLVFTTPKGLPLDDHNFNRRAWKTVLGKCQIEYRKPYCARHSAISHALANGANPFELSEQTGHDKQVMLSTYAHAIEHKSLFVEF